MNKVISCPICYGQGRIRITDFVEHLVQQEWIKCPGCAGRGVVHHATANYGVIEEEHQWNDAHA